MSSDNPYQAPKTVLVEKSDPNSDEWSFVEPKSVPVGRAFSWVAEGFRFFKMAPLIWIAITIIYFIIMLFSSFIPFATNILQPMLAGGLMLGTHDQDNGTPLEVRHLFEGFNTAGGKLAILGALMLGITMLAMIILTIVMFAGIFSGIALGEVGGAEDSVIITTMFIVIPLVFAILIVFSAVSWFGPPLIALHDLSVGDAFKMSLIALKRNLLPIIVFSIVMMFLMILTVFTLYLGLLVVIPMFIAASYASWKDIFTNASQY